MMSKQKKIFHANLKVRGYELDGYGHVNNAVYLNYFEFARWEMLTEANLGSDYFDRHHIFPTVVRVEIDYRQSCYLAEELYVETTMHSFRKRVVVFEQILKKKKDQSVAAKVLVTVVVVSKSGRAVSLPEDFESHFYTKG